MAPDELPAGGDGDVQALAGETRAALARAAARLADELCVFLSPMLLGGPVGAMGNTQWRLAQAPRFQLKESKPIGHDIFLRLEPAEPAGLAETSRPGKRRKTH